MTEFALMLELDMQEIFWGYSLQLAVNNGSAPESCRHDGTHRGGMVPDEAEQGLHRAWH